MVEKDLYVGVMSGTSLDGIDVAVIDLAKNQCQLLFQTMFPFPDTLKYSLLRINQREKVSVDIIGMIDNQLGYAYANAVNQTLHDAAIKATCIRAIGCHGQTVFHQPEGEHRFTMQLGDANIIAAHTGITTVADFRRKDMALGGQGAPLVPAFHQYLFSDPNQHRVVLNIGGIANISVLFPDGRVIGYDTGPGNMLMDAWISKNKACAFDENGEWAKLGKVDSLLLNQFLKDPYFGSAIPKSTGRERFNDEWLGRMLTSFTRLAPQDIQATLLQLTVQTIAQAIQCYSSGEVLICGGGARNLALVSALKLALPHWAVRTTDEAGISGDAMEAMAFAWLAKQCLDGKTANLISVTGASKACRLGAIYYPD